MRMLTLSAPSAQMEKCAHPRASDIRSQRGCTTRGTIWAPALRGGSVPQAHSSQIWRLTVRIWLLTTCLKSWTRASVRLTLAAFTAKRAPLGMNPSWRSPVACCRNARKASTVPAPPHPSSAHLASSARHSQTAPTPVLDPTLASAKDPPSRSPSCCALSTCCCSMWCSCAWPPMPTPASSASTRRSATSKRRRCSSRTRRTSSRSRCYTIWE
mmetsp:Transcript_30646/g.42437  ORF Transcript_30646/g.42437 Transcript_30646/m.42437 type:complete len:213 (+) Transcript_30646:363-1001(+)